MSGTRITMKDAEQALRVYCQRAGLPFGHYLRWADGGETVTVHQGGRDFTAHRFAGPHDDGSSSYVITGGLALSGAYGGYQVHQIIGLDGTDPNRDGQPCTGVRTPFGGGFQSAREIVGMLRGAITALEMAEARR